MNLSRNLRSFLIISLISVISLTFVACTKTDDGISSTIAPTSSCRVTTENLQQYDFEPLTRADIAPNPVGMNLLCKPKAVFYSSPSISSMSYILDGDPSTTCWAMAVLVKWPYPVYISRLFAATPQIKQDVTIYVDWPDVQNNFYLPNQGANIDFSFPTPQTTESLMFFINPDTNGNNGTVGISELEIYGPPNDSLKILSPIAGLQFNHGEAITFVGTSTSDYFQYYDYGWYSDLDGYLGSSFPSMSVSNLRVGTHTITLALGGDISVTGKAMMSMRAVLHYNVTPDSIVIGIKGDEIAKIKIKNLSIQGDEDPYAELANVSYRGGKTTFQAIGCKMNGDELGPVPVQWELEGGDIDAHDQLRMGILSQLGQLNTKIGNLDNSLALVASSSTVTFNSFLPGNITIKASKGNLTDSVNVRIKQPHFKVNVYPVGDVDTSIFDIWKDTALQIWEKENIIKVDSIDLMPPIANVSYPDFPLTPPLSEAENILFKRFGYLSYSNPLVYDCLLGDHSGFFYVPKQSGLLLEKGEIAPLNVFMVQEPWSYYVSDSLANPPEKRWRQPGIYSISNRDHFVTLENSGVILQEYPDPYPARYERYLAAGIGRNFGLPQYANWLNNFMDFGDNGALDVTPLQYIAALNYNNDNPQNSVKIWEE